MRQINCNIHIVWQILWKVITYISSTNIWVLLFINDNKVLKRVFISSSIENISFVFVAHNAKIFNRVKIKIIELKLSVIRIKGIVSQITLIVYLTWYTGIHDAVGFSSKIISLFVELYVCSYFLWLLIR